MKKIIIIERTNFFDFDQKRISIGGVQTYVQNLAKLAVSLGFEIQIYLLSKNKDQQEYKYKGYKIFTIHKKYPFKTLAQSCYEYIYKNKISEGDKIIITRDDLGIKSLSQSTITIQHGIGFDFPGYSIKGIMRKYKWTQFLYKLRTCLRYIRWFNKASNVVCVDYNYFNWFRTLGTIYCNQRVTVIPNFASGSISRDDFEKKQSKGEQCKHIVFARRFTEFRGTLLFANVIKEILNERDDIDVTFAGDGEYKKQIQAMFENDNRVRFTSYKAEDSIAFHKQFDIAVIPTIYAEGTSLSLLEAMAAGCVPIASHVGGMTNIILDRYNGRLFYPEEANLKKSIVSVLDMSSDEFHQMQSRAYESATTAFGMNVWKQKWTEKLLEA